MRQRRAAARRKLIVSPRRVLHALTASHVRMKKRVSWEVHRCVWWLLGKLFPSDLPARQPGEIWGHAASEDCRFPKVSSVYSTLFFIRFLICAVIAIRSSQGAAHLLMMNAGVPRQS